MFIRRHQVFLTLFTRRFFSAAKAAKTTKIATPAQQFVDLRSDTVTRPSERMYEAMRTMPIGDDDRRDCETTIKLEN